MEDGSPVGPAVDPAARRPDAFLSYSRRDRATADELVSLLEARGKDVWIDTQDIPASSRWRDELARAIEVSDAFVALVTPHWVASENCRQELEHADAAGKRIIPVPAEPTASTPEALASRQWIDLRPDPARAADAIVIAIERDLPYVRAHARYLEDSQRWTAGDRDRGFLLRGSELRAAEGWLATRAENREPRPTPEQIAFIQSSRADSTRRLRRLTTAACVATVAVIGLGIIALVQRNVAVDREHTARSRELAAISEVRRATDPETAVRLAVEGLRERGTTEAEIALRRAMRASPVVARFGGAGERIDDGAITADGHAVVAADRDGVVRALDVASGEPRWRWSGTRGLQRVALFDRDRRVAVGHGGRVAILSTADGSVIRQFDLGLRGGVTSAVPSPDGRQIAGLTADLTHLRGKLVLWDAASGRQIADLTGGDLPLQPVFSPGGGTVVVPYQGGDVGVWDASSGGLLHVLRENEGKPVNRVAMDPRGRWIASAGEDGYSYLWDAATGELRSILVAADKPLRYVRFSPDGTRVAVMGGDGVVHICAVPSGDEVQTLQGHEGPVTGGRFVDDATLVTSGDDGTARVWDLATGRQSATLLGHGLGVSVSGGSASHLLTIGEEGTARVWRLPEADDATIDPPGSVREFEADQDGGRVMVDRWDGLQAEVWEVGEAGAPQRLVVRDKIVGAALSGDGSALVVGGDALRLLGAGGEERTITDRAYGDVAVSPGGDLAVGRAPDGTIDVWRASERTLVTSVPGADRGPFGTLAFSRDGGSLAYADLGGPLVVLDAHDGHVAGSVPQGEATSLPAFAISPDGGRVFRLDTPVPKPPAIVDVATGAETALSGTTPGALDAATFSSDGSELLTAGGGAAQLWSAGTGELITEVGRDVSRTSTAALSPDDRLIVTGHDDGMVRVWDRVSGAALGEFGAGSGPVAAVATGPGGARIYSLGKDRTLRVFTCDACAPGGRLEELARRHVAFGDLSPSGG